MNFTTGDSIMGLVLQLLDSFDVEKLPVGTVITIEKVEE